MLDCCKKNKWFYFGLTIPSMLLYVLALAGPLLLGTLPASFYNWNLIKGNKDSWRRDIHSFCGIYFNSGGNINFNVKSDWLCNSIFFRFKCTV